MKVAYIDIVGGVGGDMLLGALLDAGLPIEDLRTELARLDCGGFSIDTKAVKRGGIDATLAEVTLDSEGSRIRDWAEFERVIAGSSLSDSIKTKAKAVFDLLAQAESAAHGVEKDDVHLHELGTVDTLVDVVGVIAGLERMGIERVHASPFPLSAGVSSSSHGVMAATAAATAAIYRATGAPLRAGGSRGPVGEAVTPTGAALVTTLASFEPITFVPQDTGYGAGSRNPEQVPNVVGLWIGNADAPQAEAPVLESDLVLLETNIDDMTGEELGHLQSVLMEAGALDAWLTPIQMKKGRPASLVSALCRAADEPAIVNMLLRDSSTLGVRRRPLERYVADRDSITVQIGADAVRVKVKLLGGVVVGVHPEFEDCRKISLQTGHSLRDIMDEAASLARAALTEKS